MGMKANSGFFKGTSGDIGKLSEEFVYSMSKDGRINIDVKQLPGQKGISIKKRLSQNQIEFLTKKYNVEFAQIYIFGKGKNGRGGTYYLYSGTENSVIIPLRKDVMLINHSHPKGTEYASTGDMKVMSILKKLGSPQNTSEIYPVGKKKVKFDRKHRRK